MSQAQGFGQHYQPAVVFSGWSGPKVRPKLLILGDAWGERESMWERPFVGSSGKELWRMVGEALPDWEPALHGLAAQPASEDQWLKRREDWLQAAGVAMTNVFNLRPPGNKMEELCVKKAELPPSYDLPMISTGKYLHPLFQPELNRLAEELTQSQPTLVLALGAIACWAMLGSGAIGSLRGTVASGGSGLARTNGVSVPKVLPTYHPAAVLRQWSWRTIVVADLMKAGRESGFAEIRRPRRRVLINPELSEVLEWTDKILTAKPALLASDIETEGKAISCISFSHRIDEAITIPFLDKTKPDWSYWLTAEDELVAWDCCHRLLESGIPILGQNFLYDLQYITKVGIRPANCIEDTMLLHHSFYPEMQKGLGFLGSIYTDEASWKLMRRPKADTEKRDE